MAQLRRRSRREAPRRWRQPTGPLPGAVIEQGGTQHRVRRGQLGRADPPGDLAVEFLDNGGDGAGIVAAELGEGDVQPPRVTRVPFGRGVAPLLERVGDLPGRLPGHAQARAKPLARLALAGVAVYVAIDILLTFLRPAYSLLYNAESDYGRGPWFWVMDLNFLLRCALSLAIAAALYRVVRPDGRIRGGLALLVTWAVCSGLLAFFADDPEGTPQHGSGIVHLVLAFIAFTAITIGTILISASLMSDPAWRPAAPSCSPSRSPAPSPTSCLGRPSATPTPPAASTSASSSAWYSCGSPSPPSPSSGGPQRPSQNDPIAKLRSPGMVARRSGARDRGGPPGDRLGPGP